jgi:hypothetical protein
MISGVWSKPKRLGRSASYTNLTYIKGWLLYWGFLGFLVEFFGAFSGL